MMRPFTLPLLGMLAVVGSMQTSSTHAADSPATTPVNQTVQTKRPDFSGTYRRKGFPAQVADLSFMMPWVSTEVMRRRNAMRAGRPIPTVITQCLPAGPLAAWYDAHGIQIIQLANEVIVLGETDHQIRHIHLNAAHPANLPATWGGHSIGHWEGNMLVVDTVGFNDKTEVDASGTPHSAALHVTERFTWMPDGKSLSLSITIDDPLAFKQPWVIYHELAPKDEPFVGEYACAENNKDGKVMEDVVR